MRARASLVALAPRSGRVRAVDSGTRLGMLFPDPANKLTIQRNLRGAGRFGAR
jgi:hypothetical protein